MASKATPTHPIGEPSVKEFIAKLRKLDSSMTDRQKFVDLMEMGYVSIARPMWELFGDQARAEALEKRYMDIVAHYHDKDTVRAYPELLSIAWTAVAAGGIDFLGTVAGEMEILNARNGEFFTPYPVARFMAEATLGEVEKLEADKGYVTVAEPACGAGVMILAAADVIESQQKDISTSMLVEATDLDPLCYWMCYLQLSWRGVAAECRHANTLSDDPPYERAWTPGAAAFLARHGHLWEYETPKAVVSDSTPEPSAPDAEPQVTDSGQYQLF